MDRDRPSVQCDQLAHQREADTQAARGSVAMAFNVRKDRSAWSGAGDIA